MLAAVLLLGFIVMVSIDKHKTLYKRINEINDIDEQMKAREKLMNYKVYAMLSTITILIILLYELFTWG